MIIKDIKNIARNNNTLEVLIGIELDYETTERWELEEPNALVICRNQGNRQIEQIELVDRDMKVHGYEFTESDERKISNYLEEKDI